MTEYTAHVHVPDSVFASAMYEVLAGDEDVTFVAIRSSNATWISFGLNADEDGTASVMATGIKMRVSNADTEMPEGYEGCQSAFDTSPLVLTQGRTVVLSEGM